VNSVDFSDSNGRYHEHLPPGDGVGDLCAFVAELVAAEASLIAIELGPFEDPEAAYHHVQRSIASTRALLAGARDGDDA
jgi:D-psicose/D-tagatose/L-ribulose 3-epimerase